MKILKIVTNLSSKIIDQLINMTLRIIYDRTSLSRLPFIYIPLLNAKFLVDIGNTKNIIKLPLAKSTFLIVL